MIEQAILASEHAAGLLLLARSPGFCGDWLPEAKRLCSAFGQPSGDVKCPACVFAQPFGKQHVAIVQVSDHAIEANEQSPVPTLSSQEGEGKSRRLSFHFLVLPRSAYHETGNDPFLLAERFPPPWRAGGRESPEGQLPVLTWQSETLPERTVEQLQRILQRSNVASLLGGAQVLIDGSRLVFERSAPDTQLVRDLWALLPTGTRGEIWPASFAFGNALAFNVVVVPRALPEECADYVTEDQAADYPEGSYETSLELAVKAGDQAALNALFARRGRRQTMRLGIMILAGAIILVLLIPWLTPTSPTVPGLPKPERYLPLDAKDRERLTRTLDALAEKVGVAAPRPTTAESLLDAIDRQLGTPDPQRNPGSLSKHGPVQQQLRVLLWKHGIDEYKDLNLDGFELLKRLEQKLEQRKRSQESPPN